MVTDSERGPGPGPERGPGPGPERAPDPGPERGPGPGPERQGCFWPCRRAEDIHSGTSSHVMSSSSEGSEQKNHDLAGSGASSSLTMKQAPSSVTGASGSRLNHLRVAQPIESGFTLVPGSSMMAAAARLEPAGAAASTRLSLLAVARESGWATNELVDDKSESMARDEDTIETNSSETLSASCARNPDLATSARPELHLRALPLLLVAAQTRRRDARCAAASCCSVDRANMSLRLRLRGPSGGATINVPAGASAASLEALVREALGLDADGTVELLGGHPPKPICASPDGTPLISSGDTLVVRLTTQDGSKRHCAEPEPTPTPVPPAVPDSAGLTCPACTFLNSSQQAACEVCGAPLRGGGVSADTHTAALAPIPPAVSAADQASIRSASRVDPIEREAARRKAMEAVLATAELVPPPGCKPAPAPAATGGARLGEEHTEEEEDEDAMLARAIALSQSGDFGGGGGGGGGGDGGGGGGGDGGGEQLVRRVVPADNSCLFVALALALEGGDRTRARRPSNPAPAPDSGPDSGPVPDPDPDSGPEPDPDPGPTLTLILTLALTLP